MFAATAELHRMSWGIGEGAGRGKCGVVMLWCLSESAHGRGVYVCVCCVHQGPGKKAGHAASVPLCRNASFKRSGAWAVKKKNGGKWPVHKKAAKPAADVRKFHGGYARV